MFSSGINWKEYPPKEPSASPHDISQIVSDDQDREYIYCRQCSLTLLSKEESWTPYHLDKLTERGRIEVQVWLKEKNPHLQRHHVASPRRTQETLCSACKERPAGYPGALHSIFCSAACRKQNRQHLTINRFGPVRAAAPMQPSASSAHHPDSLIEAAQVDQPVFAPLDDSNETPPLDESNAVPNNIDSVISDLLNHDSAEKPHPTAELATNEEKLEEWVPKMTVQQLKALMGAQHIPSQKKDLKKQDRVDLVVSHYREQPWGQFKADLLSVGCRLKGID